MTSEEYWRMFQVIRGDLDAAIKSNTAYLKIHALAADNREIFDEYNRFAEFWTLSTFALQTTFFIVFGRIFDPRADSYSIQKLVEATIANPALFSKAALRKRKRDHSRIAGHGWRGSAGHRRRQTLTGWLPLSRMPGSQPVLISYL